MLSGNINGGLTSHGHITVVLTVGLGGTNNYEELENLPKINNIELIGNKTSADLGLLTQNDVESEIESAIEGLASKQYVNEKVLHHFSTNESEVAIWINGKTIYEKTFVFTPNAANTSFDITALNIDTVIQIFGTFTRNSVQQKQLTYRTELPIYNDFGILFDINLEDQRLNCQISGYDYTQINEIRGTIQYTKTA
jgi:hypothetical protein